MQLHRCCSSVDGWLFWAVYTGTRPGVPPPSGRGRGGGDAGSLLPGVLPPELGASRNEPGQTRRCLQLFVPHTTHTTQHNTQHNTQHHTETETETDRNRERQRETERQRKRDKRRQDNKREDEKTKEKRRKQKRRRENKREDKTRKEETRQ